MKILPIFIVFLLFFSFPIIGVVHASTSSVNYNYAYEYQIIAGYEYPIPFNIAVNLNESSLNLSYNSTYANFFFSYNLGNNTIPSWIAINNSGILTVYLKFASNYWSSENTGGVVLYFYDFYLIVVNYNTMGLQIGEAPQLSPSYAEYDNGNQVFGAYWNFSGTSLPSGLTYSESGTGESYKVNNSLTLTDTAYDASDLAVYTTSTYGNNQYNLSAMLTYGNTNRNLGSGMFYASENGTNFAGMEGYTFETNGNEYNMENWSYTSSSTPNTGVNYFWLQSMEYDSSTNTMYGMGSYSTSTFSNFASLDQISGNPNNTTYGVWIGIGSGGAQITLVVYYLAIFYPYYLYDSSYSLSIINTYTTYTANIYVNIPSGYSTSILYNGQYYNFTSSGSFNVSFVNQATLFFFIYLPYDSSNNSYMDYSIGYSGGSILVNENVFNYTISLNYTLNGENGELWLNASLPSILTTIAFNNLLATNYTLYIFPIGSDLTGEYSTTETYSSVNQSLVISPNLLQYSYNLTLYQNTTPYYYSISVSPSSNSFSFSVNTFYYLNVYVNISSGYSTSILYNGYYYNESSSTSFTIDNYNTTYDNLFITLPYDSSNSSYMDYSIGYSGGSISYSENVFNYSITLNYSFSSSQANLWLNASLPALTTSITFTQLENTNYSLYITPIGSNLTGELSYSTSFSSVNQSWSLSIRLLQYSYNLTLYQGSTPYYYSISVSPSSNSFSFAVNQEINLTLQINGLYSGYMISILYNNQYYNESSNTELIFSNISTQSYNFFVVFPYDSSNNSYQFLNLGSTTSYSSQLNIFNYSYSISISVSSNSILYLNASNIFSQVNSLTLNNLLNTNYTLYITYPNSQSEITSTFTSTLNGSYSMSFLGFPLVYNLSLYQGTTGLNYILNYTTTTSISISVNQMSYFNLYINGLASGYSIQVIINGNSYSQNTQIVFNGASNFNIQINYPSNNGVYQYVNYAISGSYTLTSSASNIFNYVDYVNLSASNNVSLYVNASNIFTQSNTIQFVNLQATNYTLYIIYNSNSETFTFNGSYLGSYNISVVLFQLSYTLDLYQNTNLITYSLNVVSGTTTYSYNVNQAYTLTINWNSITNGYLLNYTVNGVSYSSNTQLTTLNSSSIYYINASYPYNGNNYQAIVSITAFSGSLTINNAVEISNNNNFYINLTLTMNGNTTLNFNGGNAYSQLENFTILNTVNNSSYQFQLLDYLLNNYEQIYTYNFIANNSTYNFSTYLFSNENYSDSYYAYLYGYGLTLFEGYITISSSNNSFIITPTYIWFYTIELNYPSIQWGYNGSLTIYNSSMGVIGFYIINSSMIISFNSSSPSIYIEYNDSGYFNNYYSNYNPFILNNYSTNGSLTYEPYSFNNSIDNDYSLYYNPIIWLNYSNIDSNQSSILNFTNNFNLTIFYNGLPLNGNSTYLDLSIYTFSTNNTFNFNIYSNANYTGNILQFNLNISTLHISTTAYGGFYLELPQADSEELISYIIEIPNKEITAVFEFLNINNSVYINTSLIYTVSFIFNNPYNVFPYYTITIYNQYGIEIYSFTSNAPIYTLNLPYGEYLYNITYQSINNISYQSNSGYLYIYDNETIQINMIPLSNTNIPISNYNYQFNIWYLLVFIALLISAMAISFYYLEDFKFSAILGGFIMIIGIYLDLIPVWSLIAIVILLSLGIGFALFMRGGDNNES